MARRLVPLLALVVAALPAAAQPPEGSEDFPFDPVVLVREVVRAQRRSDKFLTAYAFDQVEVRTTYGKDGRPKEVERRLYAYTSGDAPSEGTRELVEVDGRPATADEKRKVAEEDEKGRRRQLERRAAERAANPPRAGGDDDDPLIGPRRLSELLDRFDYRVTGWEVVDGRPAWVLTFEPRPGLGAASLAERALNRLAGTVVIDASDYQVRSVDARLVGPVKIGGGLAANVKEGSIAFRAQRVRPGAWLPCTVDLRLGGKKALLFRLDVGVRYEFVSYRTFAVETETELGAPPPAAPNP